MPSKLDKIYDWLKFIIMKKLPLTVTNDKEYREFSKFGNICYKTLSKYLRVCSKNVKATIKSSLPSKIGIIFDGWSIGSDHYIGLLFWFVDEKGYRNEPLVD